MGTGPLYTENAQVVQDQKIILGEPYVATYSIPFTVSTSLGTDHLLQIMAGASLNVRIRAIYMAQGSAASAAGTQQIQVLRLTTAGTGGSAITPTAYDTSDAASGATAMSVPTSKGTEGAVLLRLIYPIVTTLPVQYAPQPQWFQEENHKPIIIPAGTANGIALKPVVAISGMNLTGYVEFSETSY